MKLLIALCLLILAVSLSVNLAQASNTLRDFRDTAELERFLETASITVKAPSRWSGKVTADEGITVIALTDEPFSHLVYTDLLIEYARLDGYQMERFAISSNDYYRFWYGKDLPLWEGHPGGLRKRHGLAIARVNGKEYLIEPLIPMGWELDVKYAGSKVGVKWE